MENKKGTCNANHTTKWIAKKKTNGSVLIEQCPDFYSEMVELRGIWSHCDLNVVNKRFSENKERDAYLDKMTKAITDELFTSDGELKVGEICEVRINKDCPWKAYKMLAILPKEYGKRYIASICDEKSYWMAFGDARPLRKRTEPKIEINGEIVTYTWEEE